MKKMFVLFAVLVIGAVCYAHGNSYPAHGNTYNRYNYGNPVNRYATPYNNYYNPSYYSSYYNNPYNNNPYNNNPYGEQYYERTGGWRNLFGRFFGGTPTGMTPQIDYSNLPGQHYHGYNGIPQTRASVTILD